MRPLLVPGLLAAFLSIPAAAQKLHIDLDSIATKAAEKTELSLEGPALDFLKTMVANAAPEKRALFAGVNSISVYNYKFEMSGAYSDRDLEPLRKQVRSATGWSRVLNSKEKDETTEIYTFAQGDKISGVLLISAEADELTVIQIGGSVRLADLQELVHSTIQFADAQ